jgi:hypothetical protein
METDMVQLPSTSNVASTRAPEAPVAALTGMQITHSKTIAAQKLRIRRKPTPPSLKFTLHFNIHL